MYVTIDASAVQCDINHPHHCLTAKIAKAFKIKMNQKNNNLLAKITIFARSLKNSKIERKSDFIS